MLLNKLGPARLTREIGEEWGCAKTRNWTQQAETRDRRHPRPPAPSPHTAGQVLPAEANSCSLVWPWPCEANQEYQTAALRHGCAFAGMGARAPLGSIPFQTSTSSEGIVWVAARSTSTGHGSGSGAQLDSTHSWRRVHQSPQFKNFDHFATACKGCRVRPIKHGRHDS
jgi:hypothetical protein